MPLSNITPLFKGFRAAPPEKIDLQHVDKKTQQALSSLSQLAAVLKQNAPLTVIAVEKHWDQIWPWIQALSRSVLESEGVPKSPELEAKFTTVLDILSVILIYPIYKHQRVELRLALPPLLLSTPQILPLSTRLWLYASHHGYPPDIITALSYCVGGFMICDSCSRPNEGAPKPFLDVIGSTKYDVGEGIVKDIARHLSGPESSYHYLVGPVIILYTAQFHPDLDCRTKCLAKGVVRWLGVMIRRLISRKSKLQWAFWFDEITVCVGQGMHFLNGIVKNNPEGILEALDEGLIPAIVRARDYILEDGRRRHEEHETKGSPSAFFEEFLELIRRRLLFRRVMLRAVRAVRAVQKMELPQDDYLDAYGKVNRAWNKLEVEAERRSRIYKSEDRVANTYGEKICGALYPWRNLIVVSRSAQAAYVRFTALVFARRKTGKRIIAMNANKYEKVWHSIVRPRYYFTSITSFLTSPISFEVLGISNLSRLDIAYIENQISYDFHHANRSHIKNLSPTADQSQYVVKVDYTKGDLEPEMEVLTREQYFQQMGTSLLQSRATKITIDRKITIDFKPTAKTPPAVACFPWTGDTVKMWDVDRDK